MAGILSGMAALFPFASCGESGGASGDEKSADASVSASVSEEENLQAYDLTEFDLEKYVSPVWSGKVSFAESAFVMDDAEGRTEPIKMLYPIKSVVSVRSSDLKTLYEEGKDYEITEDGNLKILENGGIPRLSYAEYYHETYTDDGLQTQIPAAEGSGAYIVAETTKASAGMSEWCLAVTYTHDAPSPVEKPGNKKDVFVKFNEKLAGGEKIKVAYYGDSITYGWGSTALPEVDRAPYCPSYCELAMNALEEKYGATIERRNFSVSGKETGWAKEYGNYIKVCEYAPDLLILAFGMNDGVVTEAAEFAANIKNIVNNVKQRCPDTEIAVVLSMFPNELVGYQQGTTLRKYHEDYPAALEKAEEKWTDEGKGVAVADVTTVHKQILTRKTFQSTTSSNTNHPNDYMHRVYAQVLLQTLAGI